MEGRGERCTITTQMETHPRAFDTIQESQALSAQGRITIVQYQEDVYVLELRTRPAHVHDARLDYKSPIKPTLRPQAMQ